MPTDINTLQAWAAIISALITIPTLFFIAGSFTMQARATELQAQASLEQSKTTKLEVQRSVMEKRPLFFAEKQTFNDCDSLTAQPMQHIIKLTLLRNDIYRYKIDLIFPPGFEKHYTFDNFPIGAEKGLIEGSILTIRYLISEQLPPFLKTKEFNQSFAFYVKITYLDLLQNEYTQFILVYNEYDPISYPPESKSLDDMYKKMMC